MNLKNSNNIFAQLRHNFSKHFMSDKILASSPPNQKVKNIEKWGGFDLCFKPKMGYLKPARHY